MAEELIGVVTHYFGKEMRTILDRTTAEEETRVESPATPDFVPEPILLG